MNIVQVQVALVVVLASGPLSLSCFRGQSITLFCGPLSMDSLDGSTFCIGCVDVGGQNEQDDTPINLRHTPRCRGMAI